jgi:anti-sigma B factor antagonist
MLGPVKTDVPFSVHERFFGYPDAVLVRVDGELDLFSGPDFRARLLSAVDAAEGDAVIDLTGASFVDSSACRSLLLAARRLEARRARLVVVNQHPAISRIFQVMGIDDLLPVVPDLDEARVVLARAAA